MDSNISSQKQPRGNKRLLWIGIALLILAGVLTSLSGDNKAEPMYSLAGLAGLVSITLILLGIWMKKPIIPPATIPKQRYLWSPHRIVMALSMAIWTVALFLPAYRGSGPTLTVYGYSALAWPPLGYAMFVGFFQPYCWAWLANFSFFILVRSIMFKGDGRKMDKLAEAILAMLVMPLSALALLSIDVPLGDNATPRLHPQIAAYLWVVAIVLSAVASLVAYRVSKKRAATNNRGESLTIANGQ